MENLMSRIIFCKKLRQKAEGFEDIPYPGELGQRIYNEISKAAWESWLGYQTMLINEYRLSLIESKSKQFLEEEMKKFLFNVDTKS